MIVLTAVLASAWPVTTTAAPISTLRVYLNRQQANVASGVQFDIFFTTATALTSGAAANAVRVLFPDSQDGQWCRTAGTLTLLGVANPVGATESATSLPGTLFGTCAQGSGTGSAEANRDRLLLTGVDDLAAGTHYGVRVSASGAVLGTATNATTTTQLELRTRDAGAEVDTGTFPPLALIATDQITVTATVPSPIPPESPATGVNLKGIAYPSSTVTVLKNGAVAVQVPADPQAKFDISITNLTAGSYTFGVYGTDAASKDGPVSNFTVTLTTGTTVTITGIFLGPTIASDKTAYAASETVTLAGTTSPASDVTVFVGSEEEQQFTTEATGTGAWVQQVLATTLGAGSHEARSKAVDPDGSVSEYSNTVAFSIASDPNAGFIDADINRDRNVDIVDFSVLLFYWQQRNPANARADINHDGIVNIVDFSIMLYFWTATTV